MLRVSVVREILNWRISARAFETSNPRAIAPPTVDAFKKPRRESSKGHLLCRTGCRKRYSYRSGRCQTAQKQPSVAGAVIADHVVDLRSRKDLRERRTRAAGHFAPD